MKNSKTKTFRKVVIFLCLVLVVLVAWNASSKRAAAERQAARGSLQVEMGNKLMEKLNARRITYTSITFDFIPKVPRVLVHYDGLKKEGETRQLHGAIVLNLQPPDFWLVTGEGDLAEIKTSLQTSSHGFVW